MENFGNFLQKCSANDWSRVITEFGVLFIYPADGQLLFCSRPFFFFFLSLSVAGTRLENGPGFATLGYVRVVKCFAFHV